MPGSESANPMGAIEIELRDRQVPVSVDVRIHVVRASWRAVRR
jgi:hypothetical protein